MIRVSPINFLIIGCMVTIWQFFWRAFATWKADSPLGKAAAVLN